MFYRAASAVEVESVDWLLTVGRQSQQAAKPECPTTIIRALLFVASAYLALKTELVHSFRPCLCAYARRLSEGRETRVVAHSSRAAPAFAFGVLIWPNTNYYLLDKGLFPLIYR